MITKIFLNLATFNLREQTWQPSTQSPVGVSRRQESTNTLTGLYLELVF